MCLKSGLPSVQISDIHFIKFDAKFKKSKILFIYCLFSPENNLREKCRLIICCELNKLFVVQFLFKGVLKCCTLKWVYVHKLGKTDNPLLQAESVILVPILMKL